MIILIRFQNLPSHHTQQMQLPIYLANEIQERFL